MGVTDINAKKPPVIYSVRIAQHFDGHLEFFIEDVADDQRSRASVAWALRQMADALDKDVTRKNCLGECIETAEEPAMWKCTAPSSQSTAVPEGYAIVPIEPTLDIVNAGRSRIQNKEYVGDIDMMLAYGAMIAAAQSGIKTRT